MKKAILLVAVMSVCGIVQAQTNTQTTRTKGFFLDMWTQFGMGEKFSPIDLALAPGWAFNKTFFGRVQISSEYALWDVGGRQFWSNNLNVGPALGVNVWRSKQTDDRLAVVGAFGHWISRKHTWAYNYYDLGLELSDRRFLAGAGVRYYDPHFHYGSGYGYAPSDSYMYESGNSYSILKETGKRRTTFYLKIGWTIGK